MGWKLRKILTPRQLAKAKFITAVGTTLTLLNTGYSYWSAKAQDSDNMYNGEEWNKFEIDDSYERGYIKYVTQNAEVCNSWVLIPGAATISEGTMSIVYLFGLIYLFLGISIISDVFMDGIERITSTTSILHVKNDMGEVISSKKVTVWNPTVANLTLMALGSSAPEILLSVIETLTNIEECPGELGASTIVGSAAFNLLVISGLSIYAVSPENDTDEERDTSTPDGVKKIYDMGVFAITCTSSLFAYIWLFIVLTDQVVEPWEAWITFGFFFVLIILAFLADRYKASQAKNQDQTQHFTPYSAMEIYRDLINEQKGEASNEPLDIRRRTEMKEFLQKTMKTDDIKQVALDDLKKEINGENMIKRIQYRKQVGLNGKRPVIAKGEIMKKEHAHADGLDDKEKNDDFGFKCLHYSVSEASGSLAVCILNKKGTACSIRAQTIDAEALAGEDYEAYDDVVKFNSGEKQKFINIKIFDDENWEPDEDFYIQLINADTGDHLEGKDTRTRITIIDDDKPGQIAFKDQKAIKAVASEGKVEVEIIRKNGSDGVVTVEFETIQLDQSEHTATSGVDYEYTVGKLTFGPGETNQVITIKILDRADVDVRDESFGLQLSNCQPEGAKLSKKAFCVINIVTDEETKKKQQALDQLLKKIEDEEETTWGSQFIKSCMLHPTKNEDGDIEDIEPMDGLMHFLCIGWKLLFSFVPPPHYAGGWATFIVSLVFIGCLTAVVGEFANLFGCVLGVKPSVTAITFVALGTSLPDTFASMVAARQEKYADSAIGNVTGSNSVNVFLGLGLSWVTAIILKPEQPYYVPGGALGFSVALFIACAICCVIILLVRRSVVGGELGGSPAGRTGSMIALVSLWLIYIVFSILQAYGVIQGKFGIHDEFLLAHPEWYSKCYSPAAE